MKGFAWLNSLRVQIILLMTLALFPLGAVAIYQTTQVERQAAENAELALLAVTGRAAKDEELFIQRGFGIAEVFASLAARYAAEPETCQAEFTAFLEDNSDYSFIGVLPQSGLMTCSSSGTTVDFSGFDGFEDSMNTQTRAITINQRGVVTGESVFVLSVPYEDDDGFAGFVTVSLPHRNLPDRQPELTELGLIDLVTFNVDGEILSARSNLEAVQTEVPSQHVLTALMARMNTAFRGTNQIGEARRYTVVPIEGTPATVLGIWDVEQGLGDRIDNYLRPGLFPALMWFAGMAVAMLSIHLLVIRHINRMRRNMDSFADTRRVPQSDQELPMPTEIADLSQNFQRMTDEILQDEARLEGVLREKNILIKEVHHRVKNNLQLISSIMNMQIRAAEHEETRTVLSRLQDRVLSLATIHRDLYQSQHGGRVDVQKLLIEIFEKSIEVGVPSDGSVSVSKDIDPVLLYPDQAVPLSLTVAEAMTNAIKFAGAADGTPSFINLSMKQDGNTCVVTLTNSVTSAAPVESTGLGSQLIRAFVIQMGGTLESERTDNTHRVSVEFQISDFDPEARDF